MIVSIKSDSKFFREEKDVVKISFGTEYSIYMKNQNETDALVSILIDGEDVLSGNKIILRSKSILDLEGFLDGSQVKNKFKFIERISEIESHRGIKPDDGIISISFTYEKEKPKYQPYVVYYPKYEWKYVPYTITYTDSNSLMEKSVLGSAGVSNDVSWTSTYANYSNYMTNSMNENGITVKGSNISQNFGYGWLGEMEDVSTTMSLRLIGFKDETKNVFTSDLTECKICGYKSKKNYNFCPKCGTIIIK
jgi:hypothetical protein